MAKTLTELTVQLAECPDILGLVRYGSRRVDDMSLGGDFVLFVIVKERPTGLESVHFHVGEIPVDLNIRTVDDLSAEKPLTPVDSCLASGELLL